MKNDEITPAALAKQLLLYFIAFFATSATLLFVWPEAITYMPMGGHDALDGFRVETVSDVIASLRGESVPVAAETLSTPPTVFKVFESALFLIGHLAGTVLLMIPLTWTYMAVKQDSGYQKSFVRALIVLPICAATIVLLIQDSLALAFGLAALVAAVRFRVALAEAIDGIFIFAAICVGLAAGVGYLGIAAVMTVFYCFTSLVLLHLDYGANPIEQANQARKRAKHDLKYENKGEGKFR